MTPDQLFGILWTMVSFFSVAMGFVLCIVASMLLSWIWLIKRLFGLDRK